LAELEGFPGLTARRVEYLRHLGREAAEGKLEAARLRSMPEARGLETLEDTRNEKPAARMAHPGVHRPSNAGMMTAVA